MKTALLLSVLLVISAMAQSSASRGKEQRAFGLGVGSPVVDHPVPLSKAELKALEANDVMRGEMSGDPPITNLSGEGLEASVVHLGSSKEKDLIVVGSGLPFLGANVGPFWIIRESPDGPHVLLGAVALSLAVLRSRSHGLLDIDLSAATALQNTTTHLRFNGSEYVASKQTTRPNGR